MFPLNAVPASRVAEEPTYQKMFDSS